MINGPGHGFESSASNRVCNIKRKRQKNAIRMSVRVESIIKITKNASTFHNREKSKYLAHRLSHVHHV